MNKRCLFCMKEYGEEFEVCPFCGYIDGTSPTEPFFLQPGEILNHRYIVGAAADHGGFGIVYRAWDAQMEQMVAIKEYFPSGTATRIAGERNVLVYAGKRQEVFRKGVERFLTEARNMAAFSHPDIVASYDYFEENNTAYIVMEYLEGVSLKTLLDEHEKGLPKDQVVDITRHVLEALSEMHSHNIIHRDISPDNIFLCPENRIKIIDFGSARFSDGESAEAFSAVVKPGYAPAEQYRTKSRQGPVSDLYAVGACMYHALTGQQPLDSMSRSMEDTLIKPRELNADIPDYLEDIVMKAMAMDPENRFQTTQEFADALNGRVSATKKAERKKKKHKSSGAWKIIAAAVILLVLISGTAYALIHYTRLIPMGYKGDIQFFVPESKADYYETVANDYSIQKGSNAVKIVPVPDENYKSVVKKKWDSKEASIILSDDFSESELKTAEDLNKYVFNKLEGDYYFLKKYMEKYSPGSKIPLFFQVPFFAENVDVAEEVTGPVRELSVLKVNKKHKGDLTYEIKENVYDLIEAMHPSEANKVEGIDDSSFLKNKSAFYVTDWKDFYDLITVRTMMNISIVYPSEDTEIIARMCDLVSVSEKIDIQARMEAEKFVIYMLEHQDNDEYRQHQEDNVLPLNESAVNTFTKIYSLNLSAAWDKNDGSIQFQEYLKKCTPR